MTLKKNVLKFVYGPVIANDEFAGLVPQKWAREALLRVSNKWVLGANVHRNFSKEIAKYGDTVNTHLPAQFVMRRKTGGTAVTTQDPQLTNVPVVLDGWGHVSFVIDDADASLSFKDLFDLYLAPTMDGVVDGIEYSIMARLYELIGTDRAVGKLGGGFSHEMATIIERNCDELKMPVRNVFVGSQAKSKILNVPDLVTADKIGDSGTKLRKASLGWLMGCNYVYADAINNNENTPVAAVRAVNLLAGYKKGAKVLVMDGAGGAVPVGEFVTIAGDMTPQLVTASTATSLTITPGLKYDVANDAVISAYGGYATSEDYAASHITGFKVDQNATGYKAVPGNAVATGTQFNGTIDVLDPAGADADVRQAYIGVAPTAAVASGEKIGVSPEGGYGFCFDPNAIALVTRPLAKPATKYVEHYIVDYGGFGLRVVKTYDPVMQGTRMTVDFLYGTKILNENLGFMVYT